MQQKEIIIGEVGNRFRKFRKINFDSNQSLLDFDVVFLDINYISVSIYDSAFSSSNPYSAETLWINQSKRKLLEKRVEEIKEFVREGRILVLFMPKPQEFQFLEGRFTTGESFFNTTLSPRYLLLDSIEGEMIDIIPNTKFTQIFKKYEQLFYYRSAFAKNAAIGTPIAKIKSTEKIVGAIENNFLIIPALKSHFYNETEQIDLFGDELINLLIPAESDYALPEWTANYLLPNEQDLINKKDQKVEEAKNIDKQIISLDHQIGDLNKFKTLIAGTGSALEEIVTKVFKNLDIAIINNKINRDDLIIEFEGKIAVIEIKGVSKSASEEHAAQLEKWVSEYTLENKIIPKGILIVNSFREIELLNRTNVSFPDQMKRFSERRDHCLLTSVQLLGLYYDCLNKPTNKVAIINSLFETVGELQTYKDWKKIIKLK